MSKIGDRIREIRSKLQMDEEDFAAWLGISPRALAAYERNQRTPSFQVLERLIAAYPLNAFWLLTGGAQMVWRGEPSANEAIHPGVYARLPYRRKAPVGGGGAQEETSLDPVIFKRDWLREELNARPEDLFLMFMEGDSMVPTLRPHDLLLVDLRDHRFFAEGIYLLQQGEMLLVRRAWPKEPGVVDLISDNPFYPRREIRLENLPETGLQILGRVVWVGKRT